MSLIGKFKTQTHKDNISRAKKGVPKSLETIEKFKKPVLQFSLEGAFIKEWSCGKDIQDSLGISKAHISSCCNGTRKTSGRFKWKFKNKK